MWTKIKSSKENERWRGDMEVCIEDHLVRRTTATEPVNNSSIPVDMFIAVALFEKLHVWSFYEVLVSQSNV